MEHPPDTSKKRPREPDLQSEIATLEPKKHKTTLINLILELREQHCPTTSYESHLSRVIVNCTGSVDLSIQLANEPLEHFSQVFHVTNGDETTTELNDKENVVLAKNTPPSEWSLVCPPDSFVLFPLPNDDNEGCFTFSRCFQVFGPARMFAVLAKDVEGDGIFEDAESFSKSELDPLHRVLLSTKENWHDFGFIVFGLKTEEKVESTFNFRELLRKDDHYRWRTEDTITRKFFKDFQKNRLLDAVYDAIQRGNDDEAIFHVIRNVSARIYEDINARKARYSPPPPSSSSSSSPPRARQFNRGRSKAELIVNSLPKTFRPKNLLDIGCAEGSITSELGKSLGIEKENTHGCDIRDVGTEDFVFRRIVTGSPSLIDLYHDIPGFDLISLNMTLHHIQKPQETLRQTFQLLNPDGLLLIQEHDSKNEDNDRLLDVLHGLYAISWSETPEMKVFTGHFKAWYRTRREWRKVVEGVGFVRATAEESYKRPEFRDRNSIKNPYCVFHDFFIKEGSSLSSKDFPVVVRDVSLTPSLSFNPSTSRYHSSSSSPDYSQRRPHSRSSRNDSSSSSYWPRSQDSRKDKHFQ